MVYCVVTTFCSREASDADRTSSTEAEFTAVMAWLANAVSAKNLQTTLEMDEMPACLQELAPGHWQQPALDESELPDECVDWDTKAKLEQLRIINWCDASCLLYPLNTNADDDARFRTINKRNLNECLGFLKSQINVLKENSSSNLNLTQLCSSRQPSRRTSECEPTLNSQELSIFALANILCHPIVVLGERTLSRKLAGIYLPLRRSPQECSKTPLVIAYNRGHFMPLIGVRQKLQRWRHSAVPLMQHNLKMLPVKMIKVLDRSTDKALALANYLDLASLETETLHKVLSARFGKTESLPASYSEFNNLNCDTGPEVEESSKIRPVHLNIPIQDKVDATVSHKDDPGTNELVAFSPGPVDFLAKMKEGNLRPRHSLETFYSGHPPWTSTRHVPRKHSLTFLPDHSSKSTNHIDDDNDSVHFPQLPSPRAGPLCAACCSKIVNWKCEHLQDVSFRDDAEKMSSLDPGSLSQPLTLEPSKEQRNVVELTKAVFSKRGNLESGTKPVKTQGQLTPERFNL